MKITMLALSTMVVAAFAIVGCASSGDDERGESKSSTDDKSEEVSSVSSAMMVAPGGSHDGRCSGGEIIAGCAQQACTHGSGLPNPQCPMGHYCWCW